MLVGTLLECSSRYYGISSYASNQANFVYLRSMSFWFRLEELVSNYHALFIPTMFYIVVQVANIDR